MLDKKVIILGYSGHGFVVTETALNAHIDVAYYSEVEALENNPFNLEYIGFEVDTNFKGWNSDCDFILGIGDNTIRKRVAKQVLSKQKNLLNVIDTSAFISKTATLGIGNFIGKHSTINALASIGDFCILNTGSIIEHECNIGDAVHVAPGAVLLGNVSVGENTFIGANTVVKQNIKIGKNVIIGAGSVIIKDIPDNVKVVGNPGRII